MNIDIEPVAKVFDLAEARRLLPLVKAVTCRHQAELEPIQLCLNKMLANDPRRATVEKQYEQVVNYWKSKIEKLGACVYGLWVVDFDVGDGVLSWRHPELDLNYFRGYHDDFCKRVRLDNYIEESDPDWAL